MNDLNERIKAIRKAQGMTLEQFGARIGISNPAVSNIEHGKTNPSEQTIRAIIREFGVNEVWLRTGEGEMVKPLTRTEEIDLYIRRLLNNEVTELEELLIRFMAKTTYEEWCMLEQLMQRFLDERKETGD